MNTYKKGGSCANDHIECMPGAILGFDGKYERAKTLTDALPPFKIYHSLAYTPFSHTLLNSNAYPVISGTSI